MLGWSPNLTAERAAVAGAEFVTKDALFRRADVVSVHLVLTPHIGYVSKENYETFYSQMVEDIEAWLAGNPIRVLDAT